MAILTTHKQHVTFLEYAKIVKADERVAYIKENKGGELTFALPYGNMAVLMLGPGTSITQAAMHHLCSEGCMVAFTGGDGFPIFAGSLSEYRATEYMQEWVRLFYEKGLPWKLAVARQFQTKRIELVNEQWHNYGLSASCLLLAEDAGDEFLAKMKTAGSKELLLGFEANYAKALYRALALEFGVDFTREAKKKMDYINDLIDAHNYYAYGMAGATLWVLGIPHAFPVLHGDTRRGALVFDVADMIKDAYLLPLAFISNKQKLDKNKHKKECADVLQLKRVMPMMFDEVKKALDL